MGRNYNKENKKGIERGVAHGRSVGMRKRIGERQSRRIGHGTGQSPAKGKIIRLMPEFH